MRGAAVLLAALACAQPLSAQVGSRVWRPDERVIISDFSYVEALAVSEDVLYQATRGGLGIYDRRFARWNPPVTHLDGYPTEPVLAALVDPLDRSAWLGTGQAVLRYEPVLRLFESIPLPGGARDLMFDRDDAIRGIYLRGRRGWQFLPRGSPIPTGAASLPPAGRQVRTTTVEAVLQQVPFALARAPLTLMDERVRRYRYTAAAVAPVTDEIFFGTDGLGVLRVDAATTEVERLPFGILDRAVGAVVTVPGGVWTGTGLRGRRVGFAFVSDDVQRYEYDEGPPATGYNFRAVRDLTARGRSLWAATDAGVVRVEPRVRAESMMTGFGLGMEDAYALAQGSQGVWVGTRSGLAFVSDDGVVTRIDDRVVDPILALAATRDTVWVGGLRGLGVTWHGSREIVVPRDVAENVVLRGTIVALTFSADTLVAATPDRIAWRTPEGQWLIERVIAGELGELTVLAGDVAGVWVGG
ncbi:MAG: hypothetical protein GTN62_05035, partial [Gemmatimonadales bacterium]|nr:hypothetical protein [Gemmatimonadales bacterium]NIN10818.1 hypothetical protein [Gemmatimonadales bacterium]NIN49461.1 hypothetical protein [Gemmatimonadales bacterium]NIP06925.1 hypothetical protein [Gemmatimonadales bacterium]NIR01601.1 hypothetical protein [Gemmatimonadales bacterium]